MPTTTVCLVYTNHHFSRSASSLSAPFSVYYIKLAFKSALFFLVVPSPLRDACDVFVSVYVCVRQAYHHFPQHLAAIYTNYIFFSLFSQLPLLAFCNHSSLSFGRQSLSVVGTISIVRPHPAGWGEGVRVLLIFHSTPHFLSYSLGCSVFLGEGASINYGGI